MFFRRKQVNVKLKRIKRGERITRTRRKIENKVKEFFTVFFRLTGWRAKSSVDPRNIETRVQQKLTSSDRRRPFQLSVLVELRSLVRAQPRHLLPPRSDSPF